MSESLKELREKAKAMRDGVSGKAISKMSPEELRAEIAYHETATKYSQQKAKRLEALTKAREAKAGAKKEEAAVKPKADKKPVAEPKAEPVKKQTKKNVEVESDNRVVEAVPKRGRPTKKSEPSVREPTPEPPSPDDSGVIMLKRRLRF